MLASELPTPVNPDILIRLMISYSAGTPARVWDPFGGEIRFGKWYNSIAPQRWTLSLRPHLKREIVLAKKLENRRVSQIRPLRLRVIFRKSTALYPAIG